VPAWNAKFVNNESNFENIAMFNGYPMQVAEDRSDVMITSGG
jgi:hypothetical protein